MTNCRQIAQKSKNTGATFNTPGRKLKGHFLGQSIGAGLHALCLLLILAMVSGCTKSRDAKLPDSVNEAVFQKSIFDGTFGEITTSSTQIFSLSESEKLRAYGENSPVLVEGINIPGVPAAMFESLYINGEPGKTYRVTFDVNQKHIVMSKILGEKDTVTIIESQIATKLPGGELKVPVFLFKVQGHGVLASVTDAYGKATSSLRMQSATWADSSHIKISYQAKDRYPLDSSPSALDERDEIFLVERIDGRIMTAGQLKAQLDIPTPLASTTSVYTKLSGTDLIVYEITTLDSLTPSQLEIFKAGRGGGEIAKCSQDAMNTLPRELHSSCVVVARYKIGVEYKKATLAKVDFDRTTTTTLKFEDAASGATSAIVEIRANLIPEEIVPTGLLDPRKAFSASQLEGEFLMRRTLEDAANSFDFSFPGSQGPIEIVEFVAQEGRIVVKKVDSVTGQSSGSIDEEEVMSLPAKYFTLKTVDEAGNELTIPEKVDAEHDTPGAMVEIDWTSNTIPNVSSPLNYFYVGGCFRSQGGQKVTSMKQQLDKGVMNFSLEGSYSVSRSSGCSSRFLTSDYALRSLSQNTFTFKERISFRKYDGANDLNPISDLPFNVQTQFNFGVFTSTKLVPNQNGNVGRDETEVALPNVFNFKNGKTLVYTLAGIPKQGALREALIKSTQQVVDNWNVGLRKAFQGSGLATSKDLIKLEVEGRDVENVNLGDLDRNFIWYVEKKVARGILGIGGPSTNPRSGVIEASDVIIYGGNLLSSLEITKKIAQAKEFYKAAQQVIPAPATPSAEPTAEEVEAGAAAPASGGPSPAMPNMQADFNLTKQTMKLDALKMRGIQGKLDSIHKNHLHAHVHRPELKDYQSLKMTKDALALQSISRQMIESGVHAGHEAESQAIIDKEMLASLKGRIPQSEYQELQLVAKRSEFISELARNVHRGNQIVEMVNISSAASAKMANANIDQLFIDKYAAVLVHELGHALGLTHNFQGSYDKANFLFATEDPATVAERTSSSVMDYLPLDIWEDNAPGPYDIHAIRAAYTGRVEVAENVQQAATPVGDGNSKLPLGNGADLILSEGKYLTIQDFKEVLGLRSWLDLDQRIANIIPLKDYQYCTDVDVYRFPTCNRFDHGGSPMEIVGNMIDDYKALYLLRNFPDGRIRFNWYNSGGYINSIFRTFTGIRQFMDESLFRLIQGDSGTETIDHARAAFQGMMFMQSVVRTPEADFTGNPMDRFEPIQLQDGSTIFIEKKWTSDILAQNNPVGGNRFRLRTRGIEFDKAIALIVLTQRSIGVADYSQQSVRFSFADFERIFLGQQIPDISELPTTKLLAEILDNNVDPQVDTALGTLSLAGSPEHTVRVSELMRNIAAQSAIFNLEVNTLEEADNFSGLYRFGNALGDKVPTGVEVLSRLGSNQNSPTSLNYWPFDGAKVSTNLTDKALGLKLLLDNEASLVKDLVEYQGLLAARQPASADPSAPPAPVDPALDKVEKKLTDFFANARTSIGVNDFTILRDYMLGQIDVAGQIAQLVGTDPDQAMAAAESIREQNQYFAKNFPATGIIQQALLQMDLGEAANGVIPAIVPPSSLRMEYGIKFGNVELLNQLFYIIRPEYRD